MHHIFGGYHATGNPAIVKSKSIDFAVIGEGEKTFEELIKAISSNKNCKKVKGIAFEKQGKLIVTEPRERIKNLDSLQFPYRKGLPRNKYKRVGTLPALQSQKLAAIITSRGCPYNCSFCISPLMWKKQVYFRSPKNVVDEIETLAKEGINHIRILDNDFMANEKHASAVCDELIKRKIKIRWGCFGSLRKVSLHLLKKMKKAGCADIFYGIEALDQKKLNQINKELSIKAIKEGLKKTEKAGILAKGSIMIGFPGETEKSLEATKELLKELPLDILEIAFITPYSGTKLSKEIKSWQLTTTNTDLFNSQTPVIKTGVPTKKLIKWRKTMYREFYCSKQYRKRMESKIKKQPELAGMYKDLLAWATK